MKYLKLFFLTLFGLFIFGIGWIGWVSLLEHLATLYPKYQELLISPETKNAGFIVGLLLILLPYYCYESGKAQKLQVSKCYKPSEHTQAESVWELLTPKSILLQILFVIMIIPIIIMVHTGFLLIPDFVFSSKSPDRLEMFTNFICQKFNLTKEIGAYLSIITPSLISACLFYLLGGKKWLSTPRTLFKQTRKSTGPCQSNLTQADRAYIAEAISEFINDKDTNNYSAWEHLLSTPKENKTYQLVCKYLNSTSNLYPSKFGWCNKDGVEKLKEFSSLLKSPRKDKDKDLHEFIQKELK
jgi:hypothetical protein